MNKLFYILAVLCIFSLSASAIGDPLMSADNDWARTSATAQASKAPILILYTAHACSYCERLKAEVLEPMFGEDHPHAAIVRELDINTAGKMIDFNGETIRSRQFKQRYHVFATPTLLILDSQGAPLRDPIVGYNSKEQYRTLLETVLAGVEI